MVNGKVSNLIVALKSGPLAFLDPSTLIITVAGVLSIFIPLSALALLGLSLTTPALNSYLYYQSSFSIVVYGILLLLLAFFLYVFWLEASMILNIRRAVQSKYRLSRILAEAVRSYPKFLLASLFQWLVIFGGLLLLIVPGIYLGARAAFANSLAIRDGIDPLTAIRRSNELSRDVFWNSTVLFVIYLVLLGIVSYFVNTSGLSDTLIYLSYALSIMILSVSYYASVYSLLLSASKSQQRGTYPWFVRA